MNVERQAEAYREEMGDVAMRRQQNWMALGYCPHCWAPPGQDHVPICPNAVEPELVEPAHQAEALF